MGGILKQSTAVTLRIGPFLDKTDGVTEETALSLAATDIQISKNHAAYANKNDATAPTHDSDGWYTCALNTTDTNTLGHLQVKSHDSATHLPVWHDFTVLPANVYDSLVAGSDNLEVDTTLIEGADATNTINTEVDTALTDIGLDHLVSASVTGTDVTDNSIVARIVSKSATADWDDFVNTTDSLQAIRDQIDTQLPDVVSLANINAEVDTAITDAGLDHLVSASVTGTDVADDSIVAMLVSASATADWDDFVNTTDSLQAIRDRGDAAWTTGAGGSDRLLMVDTTIATLSSQTSFTLTAGSADDDAYNNCTIVIEDVATSTQKAVGLISDYTGSTKTVTLKYDPGIFTMAATDKVYILAENSLKSTDQNRQLDVTTTGAAGIDWGNVENPTTAVDLSATDIQLCDTITTYTGNTVQTGDNFARLGSPAGASIAADIAAVKTDTAAVLVDTADMQPKLGTITDLGGGATIGDNLSDMAGSTFSSATDSLEAIRDRGDSAWTTGAGGSDRLLMVDTTIATLSSQTSFTLTAGSADDDAYNNCTIVIEDAATSTQKAVGLISDYTGSTKTVTLKYDPGIFTMATTDKVYILAENSLKSTDQNRQLDVTTTGAAGIDWGNVENPTTAVDLSATDIQLCDTITTYTGNTVQTGDNFARLGAPAGASVSADIAAVKSDTAAILIDTADIQPKLGTLTDLGGGATVADNLSDMAGATFATGTDSLEAIRDRGDAAWTTGAGGSDRLLMVDTTIATLASQTSFTLTAGSADDDAYNNCTIVIEDAATSTQKAVGLISDYTGATKTVTLKYDPGIFTMATTDKVYILAENSLKSTDQNRQLDVTATGAAGIDWGNVENPSTAVDLSATDIQLCDTITTYTGNTVQTGDSFARLGAPAGASVSADVAAVKTDTAAVLVDTADMQPKLGTPAGADMSADIAAVKAETALIVADTNELQTDWADAGRLDAILDNAAALMTTQLTEAYAADGTAFTPAEALFMIHSALTEFSISGTTITCKQLDGTTTAMTYTLDDGTNPTSRTRAT